VLIDECKDDFDTLSRVVLPQHMNRLREALKSARTFSQPVRSARRRRTDNRERAGKARRFPRVLRVLGWASSVLRRHLEESDRAHQAAPSGTQSLRGNAGIPHRRARVPVTNAIVENPNHLYKYEISDDFVGNVESDNVVVNDVLVSGPSEPANSGFS